MYTITDFFASDIYLNKCCVLCLGFYYIQIFTVFLYKIIMYLILCSSQILFISNCLIAVIPNSESWFNQEEHLDLRHLLIIILYHDTVLILYCFGIFYGLV